MNIKCLLISHEYLTVPSSDRHREIYKHIPGTPFLKVRLTWEEFDTVCARCGKPEMKLGRGGVYKTVVRTRDIQTGEV
jgi:hypothetical protein